MAYGHFKGLPRRTASGKVLRDEPLIILKKSKNMDTKKVFPHLFINMMIKNPFFGAAARQRSQNLAVRDKSANKNVQPVFSQKVKQVKY